MAVMLQTRLRAFAIWQKLGYLPWHKPVASRKKGSRDFYKGAFDSIPFLNDDAKRTFMHLLLRPGYMIRDYLRGSHERYLAPLTSLIIFYAFFALVSAVLQPIQRPPEFEDLDELEIPLDPEEYEKYRAAREIYLGFVRKNRIDFRSETGWSRFLGLAGRSPEGRAAFRAFLEQRRLARGGEAKIRVLWAILRRHAGERIIVFTADNTVAYDLGRRFLLPVMTHLTRAAERKSFLEEFRSGAYPVLVTNRVLNEGVDVPAAAPTGPITAEKGAKMRRLS